METVFAIEDESFKLCISEDYSKHNFVPTKRKVQLSACKNSTAAFQIVILSDTATAINTGVHPWFSEIEDLNNIRLTHVGELDARLSHLDIHHDDTPFYYADALLRQPVVQIKENIPHSIYVEIPISQDIESGKYSGKIKVYTSKLFENEELLGELSYTVDVNNICLPSVKERDFYLDLWQHNSNIARKAEVTLWSEEHFNIIEQYIKAVSDLGQRAITVVASEIPWCGQRCFQNKDTPANLFEYSMISVKKNTDRTYSYDYSVMDRYINLCMNYGIDEEIEVFGLLGNWQSVTDGYYNYTDYCDVLRIRYEKPDGTYSYMYKAKDIENYIVSLQNHFIEMGWIDKVRVTADEPWEKEPFEVSFNNLCKIAPHFKYKSAIGKYEFYDSFKEKISNFAPSVLSFMNEYDEFSKAVKNDSERHFIWYVCCSPQEPNTYLHSDLLETRYIAVLTHFCGLKGLLRWSFTVWPDNPRKDIRYSMFAAGDTNFVYPAGDMSPLLTLRYKMLNRAIEDFELLQMVKKSGDEKTVNYIYDKIIINRDFNNFFNENVNQIPFKEMTTTKVSDWHDMRNTLYQALEKI